MLDYYIDGGKHNYRFDDLSTKILNVIRRYKSRSTSVYLNGMEIKT